MINIFLDFIRARYARTPIIRGDGPMIEVYSNPAKTRPAPMQTPRVY